MQGYSTGNRPVSGSTGAFFAGLVLGGLLGAGTMLLLAPQSGKDTRGQIQEEGFELLDQVTETVEDVTKQARDTGRSLAADLQKQGKRLGKRGRAAVEAQADIVTQVVEEEQKAIRDL